MAMAAAVTVDIAVAASTAVTLGATPRLARHTNAPPGRSRTRAWACAETFLALVIGLVYVNQICFTTYVLRVHHGDPSFIARYLPQGWFAIADGETMRSLARHVPAPELLAPTVLRVQAFLELPLVLLAYVTVLKWLDPALYRRAAGSWLVWAASASWTCVFCVVEWDLRNPCTVDDLVLRVCSALVTPFLIRWLAEQQGEGPAAATAKGMLIFAVSVYGLGQIVLTVYDTALLYNLAHLGGRLPEAAFALVVLLAARWAARRSGGRGASGTALGVAGSGLRWGLVFFFVPALAIRYGVNFGTPVLAALAGLLVCALAAVLAVRETMGGLGKARIVRCLAQLAAAALAGGAMGYAAVRTVTDTYYEAGLLRGAGVCFVVAVAVCALTDAFTQEGTPVTLSR